MKAEGYFGDYGGSFLPEILVGPVAELRAAYDQARDDPKFRDEVGQILVSYVGRPSPITFAERLTRHLGGAKIFFKREDLNHTGAHKINNTIAQAVLAKRMGKKRIIAETGAGQHGVASATAAALLGLECIVYMGEKDTQRQELNVFRMELLGAKVVPVKLGSRTLKDAISEAMRDWVAHVQDSYYLLGSVLGPHPYPRMIRDFQSVIGREAKIQMKQLTGRLPDQIIACVGGGSNAMGIFYPFIENKETQLIGVEAGGEGLESGKHAARFSGGSLGVLQGTKTYLLQNEDGNILDTHSISAGLDYAAVGPEHAYLKEINRAQYTMATDDEALKAFHLVTRTEGILPALETAHALAVAIRNAPDLATDKMILVNLSGRGDKDVHTVREMMEKADGAH